MEQQSSNNNQQFVNPLSQQQFAQNNQILQNSIGQPQGTGPIPVMPTLPTSQPQQQAWRETNVPRRESFSIIGTNGSDPATLSSEEHEDHEEDEPNQESRRRNGSHPGRIDNTRPRADLETLRMLINQLKQP